MKKLTVEEIKAIAHGVAYVTEEADGVFLHRFTPAQEQAYKETNDEFYMKTSSSAGVKLVFKTDAKKMRIAVNTTPGSKCSGFYMDVCIDERTEVLVDNWEEAGGLFANICKDISLGDGEKTVRIYMPWGVCAKIAELSLDKDAYITPVPTQKRMIFFGDSITQGLTSTRPQNTYMMRITEKLGVEARNKGIGGDTFFPALAQCTDEADFAPDYITVAYGTNDWGKKMPEQFKADVRVFYGTLSKQYPNAKIFAITPIWRADENDIRPFGPFSDLERYIRECVQGLENVKVISGYNLVGHDVNLFHDLRLHPNDEGFRYYAENLYAEMKEYI